MKIKRCPLVFNNVISTTARCKSNEWYMHAKDLRNAILKNGLYATGPVIYQVSGFSKTEDTAEYTFHMPVNEYVEMPENDKYSFSELWKHDDGFLLRHPDLDDNLEESYEILRSCAQANGVAVKEPFYNIYLDVYGDGIIDIYAPIEKGV